MRGRRLVDRDGVGTGHATADNLPGFVNELLQRVQSAVGEAFRIERELGGGGMSRVFLATETALGRSVAIKLLAPELTSELLAARFRREFQVTAVLGQHPHILPVLSTGARDGLLYYITPYIEGESLRHRLRREGRLPVDDAVRLLVELGSALAFAHEKGIVHRDLKPENVLLADGLAILADFGISAVLARADTPPGPGGDPLRLTELGMAVGTPGYMSPEQAAGDLDIDGRADIYSLAVIGFEMLTGAPPFSGASPLAVMQAHLDTEPPVVSARRPEVPRAVSDAIARALSKRPEDRFQSAEEFCQALGIARSGGRSAAIRIPRPWKLAAVAAAVVAVAGYTMIQRTDRIPRNANLVAVAPFEALGPDLAIWREGLVDLLAGNLDGAGPLRAVPPSLVLRRASARMDASSARLLADRTGAGITVHGSLIASGPDSVRVTATIHEIASGRTVDVQLRDATARMDRLADSLSVAILRELGRTRAIGATRLASLGSSSLPALKAYLQGEQAFRRSDWDSAAVHYERAVALDSTFAPALRHLSNALSWRLTPSLELAADGYRHALRAGELNRGLTPRESLLVAADSLFAALQVAKPAMGGAASTDLVRRLAALLENGVRRFPDDVEMWYKHGDVQFHFTRFVFPSRSSMRTARQAFERAIALDSAFAPAYIHHMELAAHDQDVAALRRSASAYLSLGPHDVHARSIALVQSLLDTRDRRARGSDSTIAAADLEVLQSALSTVVPLMDSAETQVLMSHALYEASRTGRAPAPMSRDARRSYTLSLLARGHLAQAMARADSDLALPLLDAALLRASNVDSIHRLIDRWFDDPGKAPRVAVGAVYWALIGDSTRLGRAISMAASGKLPTLPARLLPGLRALAVGDTTAAIAALTLADSACAGWCWQARLPLSLLLSARGRDREAAAVLDQDFLAWPTLRVLWMLERGRVNERLGDRPTAVDAYLYVANAWRDADPPFQPYVAEARRGIERMQGDRARS